MEQLDKTRANTIKITSDFEKRCPPGRRRRSTRWESSGVAAEGEAAQMREKGYYGGGGPCFQMQQREADANECERAIAVLSPRSRAIGKTRTGVKTGNWRPGGRRAYLGADRDPPGALDEISARMVWMGRGLEEPEAQSRTESKSAEILQAELEALRKRRRWRAPSVAGVRQGVAPRCRRRPGAAGSG